jgi:hypothetical protein
MVNSIIGVAVLFMFFWGIYGIYLLTENPFKEPYIIKILKILKD